jgi:hypothetical protein
LTTTGTGLKFKHEKKGVMTPYKVYKNNHKKAETSKYPFLHAVFCLTLGYALSSP